MASKPRFFCDNCGAEVPMNSKSCHKCGRFFASVRCPSCGFTGEESLFKKGCPACGYSASQGNTGTVRKNKKAAAGLPMWVYILTSAIFTAVLAALLFRVFN